MEAVVVTLLGQLRNIVFAQKFPPSLTISGEAPESGSLYTSQLVRMEGRPEPNIVPLRSAQVIIIVLGIHYSPHEGAEQFVF